jgi:hypothetical protein
LSHEHEIKRFDRVTGKVVVRIPEEGRVRNHERRQPCIPEGSVITQAGFRQDPSVEGQEQGLDRQISILTEAPYKGTSKAKRAPVSDYPNEVALSRIARPTSEKWIGLPGCRIANHL